MAISGTLTSIYVTMRQSLKFSVLRIVRDPQISEDLTQETYRRARRALEREPLEHVEAFLHHVARNLALGRIDLPQRAQRQESTGHAL